MIGPPTEYPKIIAHIRILRIGRRIGHRRSPIEVVPSAERIITAKPVGVAMQAVGALARNHVDDGPRVSPKLRIEAVSNHPELLGGIGIDA